VLTSISAGATASPLGQARYLGCHSPITLLAPGMKADFEIHVSGWIGASPGADAPDLVPELRRIDPGLLQCVYGAEEKAESACAALAGAEVIETPGGHHFDEDYQALTRRIVDGLVRRGAWPGH
jgi:type IV secretory pathway VirJ component